MKIILLILIVFALFLPANNQNQVKTEPTLTFKPPEYYFERNAIYWYALSPENKIQHVLQMMIISNEAFKFNVHSRDSVKAMIEANQIIENVLACVSEDATNYLLEFKADIDLGSVMIQCMIKNRMHD